jgi:hypothetical protein
MLLEHCDTLVSSGLLRTSVGNPYYVRSARGLRPIRQCLAPLLSSAPPSTVDDDGGRGSTARNARRVHDRSLKLLWRSVYSENGERAQR